MRENMWGKRRRTVPLMLAGFLIFVLAELSLLIWVSTEIGWWTLGALLVSTVLGSYLLQREWRKAWQQLADSVKTGSLPPGRTADAVLVLLGGFMLIMPGFITDVIGLLLLLPFTRPGIRSALGWWASTMMAGAGGSTDNTVIEGEIVDPGPAGGARGGTAGFPEIIPEPGDPRES
ncbi:FxsA family protein [Tessaracoccus sp.]